MSVITMFWETPGTISSLFTVCVFSSDTSGQTGNEQSLKVTQVQCVTTDILCIYIVDSSTVNIVYHDTRHHVLKAVHRVADVMYLVSFHFCRHDIT